MSLTVSVIGCGWLGLPVAKALVQEGYRVKGSTTSIERLQQLESQGVQAYQLKVSTSGINGPTMQSFFETDLLYLNIPPQSRREAVELLYPQEINQIIKIAKDSGVKKIIFVSSTGVYSNVGWVTETSPTDHPASPSGLGLCKAEELIKNSGINWIIVRMAGLAGPNREPGRWFAGKQNIPHGLSKVNMIHLDDCVNISLKLIIEDHKSEIFNACADQHPTKLDFYKAHAAKLGLEPPTFIAEAGDYKMVSNEKIKRALNYQFKHPDPLQF